MIVEKKLELVILVMKLKFQEILVKMMKKLDLILLKFMV